MNSIYEKYKLYRANPCDLDTTIPGNDLLAKIHQLHTTNCNCCSGARIVISIVLAFTLGYVL